MLGDDTNNRMLLLLQVEGALALGRAVALKMLEWAWEGNPAAVRALAEVQEILRELAELATVHGLELGPAMARAGHPMLPPMRDQAANLQNLKFNTNDIVDIRGALEGERSVQICGLSPINLGKRPFLVLKVLARHAHAANPGAFLGVNEIVQAVLEDPVRKKAEFWHDVVPEDIHKVVRLLREDIKRVGGNARLIESGKSYAAGLRLSTPSRNIFLEDLDAE